MRIEFLNLDLQRQQIAKEMIGNGVDIQEERGNVTLVEMEDDTLHSSYQWAESLTEEGFYEEVLNCRDSGIRSRVFCYCECGTYIGEVAVFEQ